MKQLHSTFRCENGGRYHFSYPLLGDTPELLWKTTLNNVKQAARLNSLPVAIHHWFETAEGFEEVIIGSEVRGDLVDKLGWSSRFNCYM